MLPAPHQRKGNCKPCRESNSEVIYCLRLLSFGPFCFLADNPSVIRRDHDVVNA